MSLSVIVSPGVIGGNDWPGASISLPAPRCATSPRSALISHKTATSLTGDPSSTFTTAWYQCSTCHPGVPGHLTAGESQADWPT
jgi:hypothetical protein